MRTGRTASPARLVWAAVALAAAVGLAIDIALAVTAPNDPPGDTGTSLLRLFSYFTVESNILVLATTVPLVRNPHHDGGAWRVLRVMALLGITITALVYWVVLAPTSHPQSMLSNICLHYLSPIGTVGGWLLFGPWPRMSLRVLRLALVWPVLWVAYTLLHGAASGWYPYDFIDVTVHGYRSVAVTIVAIFVLGVVLLAGFRAVDSRRRA